jgi:histidinol-phosphate aminotransferase
MSAPQPKPSVLQIAPYVAGKARAAGFAAPLKLSANENPLGCSPMAREAYLAAASALHQYPDPRASRLRAAVSEKFGLEPERLIFGCGSDELFNFVCQTYCEEGSNVVQPAHGFAAWAIAARAAGAEVKNAPEKDLTADVDALLAQVDGRTRVVFLANPANPTGAWLPFPEVRRLHEALPEEVVLVLDGAYAEFAREAEGFEDGLELARSAPNLFVTRTFSKLYGLATLRVGWGYAPAAMALAMDRLRPPFNVSGPAEAAAVAGLADADFTERSLAHVARWRPVYAERLAALGLEPVPSATNFVTFRVPSGAAALEQALAERGVLVRGLSNYGLPEHLRITIGSDADSERVLGMLGEIVGQTRTGTTMFGCTT